MNSESPRHSRPVARWYANAAAATCAALVLGAAVPAMAQSYATDERGVPPGPPRTLDELASRFLPQWGAVTETLHADLAYDGEARIELTVTSGVCYAFAAVGAGFDDLDVWVWLDGAYAGQDVRPDAWPIVEWCAPRDGSVRMRVHAFQGEGPVEYGVFAWRESQRAASGPQDELSNRLAHAAARSAPRWFVAGEQWRRRFARPQIYEFDVTLDAGRCYALLAVGDAGVNDVDLMLLDGDTIVAQDLAVDATPVLVRCAVRDETLAARVIVAEGAGFVAAQLLSRDP